MDNLHREYIMLLNNSFTDDFEFFKNKILNGENFAFTRYADGEKMILDNINISHGTQAYDIDKWRFENNKVFSNDLKSTCNHREQNYFHAISCKCCDPDGEQYYRKLFDNHNITFSNLFINANYLKFISFIKSLKRDVVFIANKECKTADYPFNIIQKIPIENDCVNWYEKNKILILKVLENLSKKYNNKLFFISAGPLSEIIIHHLYINNPNNTYIDIGSSLDIYTHKKITRPYQIDNSQYKDKECIL